MMMVQRSMLVSMTALTTLLSACAGLQSGWPAGAANLVRTRGNGTSGRAMFQQACYRVMVTVRVEGLNAKAVNGFHIH